MSHPPTVLSGNAVIELLGHNGPSPVLVFVVTSLVSYSIYKRYEPNSVPVNALLLLAVPAALQSQFSFYISSLILRSFAVSVAYWSSLLMLTVAYRLSPIHPLAKFPGPTLAKISKFWAVYLVLRGDGYEILKRYHEKYGDAIRIGPNELSFRRGDLVDPILNMKMFPKGPFYDTRNSDTGTQLDGIRDFSHHAMRRKPWNKALSITAINGYKHIIHDKTEELLEALSERRGQTVDLSAYMSFFGFDFMGQMAFGRDFGMLKAGRDTGGLWHLMERGIFGTAVLSHVPWIISFIKFIPGWDRDIRMLQKFGRDCVAARMNETSRSKDLYYYLVGEDGSEKSTLAPEMAETDGMLALIAGSDTTATTLTHVWYFMIKHPECLAKLRKEIDATFPNGEEANDTTRHAKMPYLNACINEVLRVYPSVLGSLQRMVEKGSDGAMLGDWYVPPGTQISINHYSLQRDPREFYPLPDTFWPDRWLFQDQYTLPTGETIHKSQLITNRAAFIPFSTGPQSCAGKSLALMELRAVTCAITSKLDVELAPGFTFERWIEGLRDFWVSARGPLPVRITPRKV